MYTPLEGLSVGENELSVQVFPNPSSDYINIKSEADFDEIRIYDHAGRIILESQQTAKVDVRNAVNGNYILAAFSNGNLVAKTSIAITK